MVGEAELASGQAALRSYAVQEIYVQYILIFPISFNYYSHFTVEETEAREMKEIAKGIEVYVCNKAGI